MKKFFTMIMLSCFVFGSPLVFGQDEEAAEKKLSKSKEELKARITQYIETGKNGVFYDPEKDVKNGSIIRLFVVGTSTITTAIGVEEGLEAAHEAAEEGANSALLKFLENKVSISKNSKGELIINKEGEENGNDEGDSKTSMKKISKTSKDYKEAANSCVKGLKVAGVDHKGKTLVAVYRLETSTLNSIDKLKKRLNTTITGTDATSSVDGDEGSTKAKNSKVIPNKRVIIVD